MMARTFPYWSAIMLLLATSFGGGQVHAQSRSPSESALEEGRQHFKSGVDYYRDGDLDGALLEFKRAYSIAPNYRVLYNLGRVSSELRQYVEAQKYLQRYLSEGGSEIDAPRRQEAEALLTKIAGRIATLSLSSNVDGAELFVDGVSVGRSPLMAPVPVGAGTRRLAAALEGRPRIERVIEAGGGENLSVSLDFPAQLDTELRASTPSGATQPEAATNSGPNMAVVWLGVGTGALAVGAGVMAYLGYQDTSDYQDALKRKTTERELDSLHDGAAAKALVADVLLGATAVAGAITLIVALTSGDESERPATARNTQNVQLTLGARSLGIAGTF